MTHPTERHCPESPGGLDTHHLVPTGGKAQVMRCSYCNVTEASLREHGGTVKRTQDELIEEMTRRFGPDQSKWAFRCPACGDISRPGDFLAAYPDEMYTPRWGQECIGRSKPEGGRGCDWAAYGLFRGPEYVIRPGLDPVPAFPIAPVPEGPEE